MPKSKKTITRVVESYITEIERTFPGAVPEVIYEAPGGFDVWIRVELPPKLLESSYDEIMDELVELDHRYWEKTGVSIVTTLAQKEAVTNG